MTIFKRTCDVQGVWFAYKYPMYTLACLPLHFNVFMEAQWRLAKRPKANWKDRRYVI